MRFTQDHEQLRDAEVVDVNGDRVGGVGQVYLDDTSGEVEWVTVRTGFFGLRETVVPMSGANVEEGRIQVPFEKSFIKDAPNVDLDAHLDRAQQDELYRYYGDSRADRVGGAGGVSGTGEGYGDQGLVGTDPDRDLDRREDSALAHETRTGDETRIGEDLARDGERLDTDRDLLDTGDSVADPRPEAVRDADRDTPIQDATLRDDGTWDDHLGNRTETRPGHDPERR